MKKRSITYYLLILLPALLSATGGYAQTAVEAKVDARQIMVGDQLRLFIEAKPAKGERLVWAAFPDTFNNLEIVEKGKIDTLQDNGLTTYKQRLLITGWDSGMFTIPVFTFTSVPQGAQPYTITTDSFAVMVQTVPVDTTQPFKPIVDIMSVKMSWRDYIWYIVGGIIAIALIVFLVYYFRKNKKTAIPVPSTPKYVETPYEKALRLLNELEQKQLWQQGNIKEYYTELTDVLREFIEERFRTQAMELTTDELLVVVRKHKDMMRHHDALRTVLQTADMAKFAKAEPLPQEHVDSMELTRQFVQATVPVVVTENPAKP